MKVRFTQISAAIVAVFLLAGGMQFSRNQVTARASKLADAAPQPVEDDMHEFMEYAFQPTYRRLKASMAKAPATTSDWKAIKADLLVLAEGGNLLLIRSPGDDTWNKLAVAVRRAGGKLYKAAGKKDLQATQASYAALLNNCNACHREFADGKHQLTP